MPSHTIDVSFMRYTTFTGTPASEASVYAFMIKPLMLPIPQEASGTMYDVTFNLDTNVNEAKISRIDVLSGQPPDYTPGTLPSINPTISFTNTGLSDTDKFNYEITVTIPDPQSLTGAVLTFTSADPEMQIPPPNG